MYSQDTINQFIELRSQGKSLRKIADQLDISIGTAVNWDADHKEQIRHFHRVRLEALQERFFASHEDKLSDITDELNRINAELKQRDFECVSTEFLLYRKTCLQARLEKLAVSPSPVESLKAAPESPKQN